MLKKRLGQHFLKNQSIIDKIESYLPYCKQIIEIGGGDGALTKMLMSKADHVITFEIDDILIPILQSINPNVIHCDVLKYDFTQYKNSILVSNLPYNISVILLLKLFKERIFTEYYVMVQKEVGMRMRAKPRDNNYGKLSILTQYSRNITKLFDISPGSFYPKPKVLSEFIHIKELYLHTEIEWDQFSTLLQNAFNYRRKKLKNTIQNIYYADNRPEELSIKDWISILFDRVNKKPH